MMRPVPIPPPDLPPGSAYLVPWSFDRSLGPPRFALDNIGAEVLHAISLHLLGSGTMASRAPLVMRPGDRLVLTIRADDLARDTVLLVRWFRPNGEEYLWRVSF
jgi:tRNA threonylcarbamoyladenosine modification (KEOPS) complex  Pcc1 subunit